MRSTPSSTSSRFLSTPSARRATRCTRTMLFTRTISIHALREEGDETQTSSTLPPWKFLSTPSARRATVPAFRASRRPYNFYPRPPRGGRPTTETVISSISNFYPRPPRGGRPPESDKIYVILSISIHALREEGDRLHQVPARHRVDFYPRPPRGGRPYQ